MKIRQGVALLAEEVGSGAPVERKHYYVLAIRITLNQGEVVRSGERVLGHQLENLEHQDDGYFVHRVRVDRENMIGGVFYAIQGMSVGGYRKIRISPHLAYGEKGVPEVIPPNAVLTVEIKVLARG